MLILASADGSVDFSKSETPLVMIRALIEYFLCEKKGTRAPELSPYALMSINVKEKNLLSVSFTYNGKIDVFLLAKDFSSVSLGMRSP